MKKYINKERPPFFCPGCAHDRVVSALEKAFSRLKHNPEDIVIVSDIGCAGLFDTFYNTHAFHGLHGRALTYATGIKLAKPELTVIAVMGDGGIGIGGAHLLSACKKNVGITLLVLNNFNYGMTGGQFSSTTPMSACVNSAFLNQIEQPLDIGQIAASAGAGYVARKSAYHQDLPGTISNGITHQGFSVIDIWGACVGRYTKQNKLTPKNIDEAMLKLPPLNGVVALNVRDEYSRGYQHASQHQKPMKPQLKVSPKFKAIVKKRQEIMILGNAGQRIVTAGEILCIAGMLSGLHATQKSDYPVTVLRGHSVGEIILSPLSIDFTGAIDPNWLLILGMEGLERKKNLFSKLKESTIILKDKKIKLPPCQSKVLEVDFRAEKIKTHERAMVILTALAKMESVITLDMLNAALEIRFAGDQLKTTLSLVNQVNSR
jgi:2-oxoglutarate/2-oxoacid ferredoxin oxidoreductase subunit beta